MFGVTEVNKSAGFLADLGVNQYIMSAWGVIVVLAILSMLATRNIKTIPSGLQNVLELMIGGLYDFFEEMLGAERIKKYFPLLCTFFLFILISNYIGLLPLAGHEGPYIPPTANISVTAALAVIVFFSTHVFGIMEKGIGYFSHFLTPMWWMLPLNIVEEIVRPVSLAMRLYGNIFGHELVVGTLMLMSPWLIPVVLQLLGTLTGAIQAFVFTLLATTYIAGATEKHH